MADNTYDINLISEETGQDIANALKGTFAAFDLGVIENADGTNTTSLWRKYLYQMLAAGHTDRYEILTKFMRALAAAWGDKTYTLRGYDASLASGLTALTPMDDLAGKSAAQLCTDSTEAVEDWADEDPMTWYIRANALSLQDGSMNILAFEGEADFDLSGETAPVYTFQKALYLKEWNDGTYDYISYRTTRLAGYYPDAGDVAPDNSMRVLTWHPSFEGGLNSAGKLTSGAGIAPYIFASANDGLTKARLWDDDGNGGHYEGLWNDCDTRWALRMWQLRHFDKENSNILEGCTNYSLQYVVALAETDVKRVLVTTAQGANFIVGSSVCVGDPGENTNYDRYYAYMRNIAGPAVRISSIENVTIDGVTYTALNLEVDEPFTTTANARVSSMPWYSGTTEALPEHKDGSILSLTNGKTPMRVSGVEFLGGAYTIGLDPLYNVTAGSDADHFNYQIYECRNSEHLAGSITSNHIDTGIRVNDIMKGWNWPKRFIKTKLGVLFPDLFGGSSSTFYKSAFRGASSAGVRCPWRFAALGFGGFAGLACEVGDASPGDSYWSCRPRLGGSGKKRGEWAA
jgi:hypothetical protein